MSKSKRSWKLLRPSRDGQRVWQDTFTGDLYVADHSGDWGRNSENVGTPDKTDDGPLRIVKRGTTDTVNMTASDGCWFVSVRAERDQRNGTVLLDFPCALFIAGQLGGAFSRTCPRLRSVSPALGIWTPRLTLFDPGTGPCDRPRMSQSTRNPTVREVTFRALAWIMLAISLLLLWKG